MKGFRTLSLALVAAVVLIAGAVGLWRLTGSRTSGAQPDLVRVVIARKDSGSLSIKLVHSGRREPKRSWARTESFGNDGRLGVTAFSELGVEVVAVELHRSVDGLPGEWMLALTSREGLRVQLPPESESVVRSPVEREGEVPLSVDFVCGPGRTGVQFVLPGER